MRESDAILREEFAKAGLDKKVWQYFHHRSRFQIRRGEEQRQKFRISSIIRAVNTIDAMTATIEDIDWPILHKITDRILAEVEGVNRVCYDDTETVRDY